MSALGQKQTSAHVPVMSALPPKTDIGCVVEYPLSANFANALTRLGFHLREEMPITSLPPRAPAYGHGLGLGRLPGFARPQRQTR